MMRKSSLGQGPVDCHSDIAIHDIHQGVGRCTAQCPPRCATLQTAPASASAHSAKSSMILSDR
eukprot:m.311965 g.311965  ORF g.311965 m.311965 type:complete len:63 (+) comp27456_c0_seq1:258-446(+)